MIRSSLAALMAFLFFLILHFFSFHYMVPTHKVNALLLSAGAGMSVFFLLLFLIPQELWFQNKTGLTEAAMQKWIYPVFALMLYGFLFLGYLEFYFTADRSITFRMLMITDKQPDHSVTRNKMWGLYDVDGIISRRFEDLVYGGYLVQHGDTYHITGKGRVILGIYKFAIDELHLGSGEISHEQKNNKLTV